MTERGKFLKRTCQQMLDVMQMLLHGSYVNDGCGQEVDRTCWADVNLPRCKVANW